MPSPSSEKTRDGCRYEALARFVRRMRHDLATPLSAATIHLEVVSRRLESSPASAHDSLRVSQRELGTAAAMLDVLSEIVTREDDETTSFSLADAMARGAARPARPGVTIDVEIPESDGRSLVGSRTRLEDAIAAIGALATEHSTPGGRAVLRLEAGDDGAWMTCTFPGRLPAGNPEQLFGLTRPDLCLARFTIESYGGSLTAEQHGPEGKLVAHFPEVGA